VQFVVSPVDQRGDPVRERVRWSCATPHLASISEDGVLTANAPGSALVWAEVHGVRATTQLPITPARVASLRLGTIPETIEVGAQVSIGATPLDASARPLADRTMVWLSSDPDVGSVSGTGVVTAHRPGHLLVTCTCGDETAMLEVTVVETSVAAVRMERPHGARVGVPFQLEAEALSRNGRRVGAEITFQSTAPDVATVDDRGVVTPLSAGEVTIFASASGVQGMVSFLVSGDEAKTSWRPPASRRALARLAGAGILAAAVIAFVVLVVRVDRDTTPEVSQTGAPAAVLVAAPLPARRIEGAPSVVIPTDTFTLRAVGLDGAAWSSSDSSIAVVDATTGAVRVLRVGATTIVAASGTDSLRLPLAVTLPAGMMVRIAPVRALQVGDSVRLVVQVQPRGIPVPSLRWESRAPSVLAVRPGGRAEALAEGSVFVIARWADGADSAQVTIRGVALERIELSRTRLSMQVGDTARITARIIDARGQPVTSQSVTWTSANRSAVSVTADGLVEAHAPLALPIPLTAHVGTLEADVVVDVRESRAVVTRRLAQRTGEFVAAARARDTAQVRALASGDGAALQDLVGVLTRRDVTIREVGRREPVYTDSASVQQEVQLEYSQKRTLRADEKGRATFVVRLTLVEGQWRFAGVSMTQPFGR
jgi:uncharacterized protein YjdB